MSEQVKDMWHRLSEAIAGYGAVVFMTGDTAIGPKLKDALAEVAAELARLRDALAAKEGEVDRMRRAASAHSGTNGDIVHNWRACDADIAAARREGLEWAVQHPRFSGDCHAESDEAYRARGLAALGFK